MKEIKLIIVLIGFSNILFSQNTSYRTISKTDYFDKVYGGWIGKIAGLTLGVPKEFNEPWPPSDINYFAQIPNHFSDQYSGDDLYYPLLAQTCLEKYGLHPSYEQIMKEFDTQLYSGRVWGATSSMIDMYRAGILPPKTGLPGYNSWDNLDAMISFDPMGWICPGMINKSAAYSDYWAHIDSWGEGADGCVFINALYSEAFFTNDMNTLINKALEVLPAISPFHEMVGDLIKWHSENKDWRDTRMIFAKKYGPRYKEFEFTALANSGAVLIGLLYGEKDCGKTVIIAMQCRWDSDCNAATAGGIIGTILGYSNIEPKWTTIFHDSYENYCIKGLPRWLSIKNIAENTVLLGEKVMHENKVDFVGEGLSAQYRIPVEKTLQLTRNEVYTKEMEDKNKKEKELYIKNKFKNVTKDWNPIWTIVDASFEKPIEIFQEYLGRKNVLKGRELVLESEVTLEKGKFHYLKVGASNTPAQLCEQTGRMEIEGAWNLILKINDVQVDSKDIGNQGDLAVWIDNQFDLSKYAGQTIKIKMECRSACSFVEFNMDIHSAIISEISFISQDKKDTWR